MICEHEANLHKPTYIRIIMLLAEINHYIFYELFIFMSLMKRLNIASNADKSR